MKKFTKGIITFVFALMALAPFSVLAATEITNADLDAAKENPGEVTEKRITYDDKDGKFVLADGEYSIGEDLILGNHFFEVDDANVTFDLNGKELSTELEGYGVIEVYGNSEVTITGNGTVTGELYVEGGTLNIENGTYNGRVEISGVDICGHGKECEIKYAFLNIKNGTFKGGVTLQYANAVIDDGTFTGGLAGLLVFNEVEKVTLNGGTYKATAEEAIGAIVILGEDTSVLTKVLGEGCSYEPELVAEAGEKFETKYVASQKEITVVNPNAQGDTIEEITVLEGANQTYIIGESDTALFRLSADYSLFETGGKIYVDDNDASNYTSASGSTIIKLLKSYMDGLSLGEHVLKVEFNNGNTASAKFIVKGSTVKNPNTSDNTLLYVGVLGFSIMCFALTSLYLKRINVTKN